MKPDPFSLDRLQDIVEPPPVPWWPPAVGWYFIIAIVLLWAVWFAVKGWMRWQRNAYRRQGLQELGGITKGDFAGLSTLLKRVALVGFPREQVAGLIGNDWTHFLATTSRNEDFESAPACRIGTASYEPSTDPCSDQEWDRVTEMAAAWIRHHDAEAQE